MSFRGTVKKHSSAVALTWHGGVAHIANIPGDLPVPLNGWFAGERLSGLRHNHLTNLQRDGGRCLP